MDFEKLLKGKTKSEVYAIAEIWYARLNYLKSEVFIFDQSEKRKNIIAELIVRLMALSQLLIKIEMPMPPKHFESLPLGGIKFKSDLN